jgi:hypothetical protein
LQTAGLATDRLFPSVSQPGEVRFVDLLIEVRIAYCCPRTPTAHSDVPHRLETWHRDPPPSRQGPRRPRST